MQVDPIKHTLTAPGIKLFKVKRGKPLSKFAFNLNLRRYIQAGAWCKLGRAYTRPLFSST